MTSASPVLIKRQSAPAQAPEAPAAAAAPVQEPQAAAPSAPVTEAPVQAPAPAPAAAEDPSISAQKLRLLADGDLGVPIDPAITTIVGTMAQTHGSWTKVALYTLAEYTQLADPKYAMNDVSAFVSLQRRLWSTVRTILTTEEAHYTLQLSAALGIIHAYREGAFADNAIFRHCEDIPVSPAAATEMRYLITMLIHLADPTTRKTQAAQLAKGIAKYTTSLGEGPRNRLLNYLNLN